MNKSKKKILFVQFANSMYLRHKECDDYWDAFYAKNKNFGYERGKYNFEIPKWIAEIDYLLDKNEFDREVFYCQKNIDEIVTKVNDYTPDFIFFSLMDSNKKFIEDAISKMYPWEKIIVGGYNESFMKYLGDKYKNVQIVNTIEDDAKILGVEYKKGTDYTLFEGETVLPRLTMSYGCTNNCKFCIVPHGKITPVDDEIIMQQVNSFRPLKFKLVYIDDKTFGQCVNHVILKYAYNVIKAYNPEFEGFVIQTTTKVLKDNYDLFEYIGVKVAEVGFETMNDSILKKYNKPSSEALVEDCVKLCNERKTIKLILNVVVGFEEETEETYTKTNSYIVKNLNNNVIGINPAIYTDYSLGDDCLGEIDFNITPKIKLHLKYWSIINSDATDILKLQKSLNVII